MKFSVKDLCTPASIYFWVSIIGLTIAFLTKFKLVTSIINLFFILLWTYFLNYLCSKGYSSVSWFLVLLPIIIFAGVLIKTMDLISISR
uniref:Uncharacterized protein n=1 Tax=viral metagenome TaxID=1070528 RepID=A0A6C0HDM3_9ZZZZ